MDSLIEASDKDKSHILPDLPGEDGFVAMHTLQDPLGEQPIEEVFQEILSFVLTQLDFLVEIAKNKMKVDSTIVRPIVGLYAQQVVLRILRKIHRIDDCLERYSEIAIFHHILNAASKQYDASGYNTDAI